MPMCSSVTAAGRDANRKPPWSRPATRVRPGFTLVELLVALLLVDVGLLALVATSAAVTRELDASGRRNLALESAVTRLERLSSMPCRSDDRGDEVIAPGIHEWWSATVDAGGTRRLEDSVTFATRGAVRSIVLRTRARCLRCAPC
jgi:Tfp pilus assembly protein PilV